MQLQDATREQVKLKLNISGPSGSGKTAGALLMAYGLVEDWSKIGVIDTENRSASLYSNFTLPNGEKIGKFKALNLEPPFSPERYIQAIDICLRAGMQCIVIDSSTHEWDGPGGAKDINDKLAQLKYKGNTWAAWNETTPRHDAFVTKVLQCDCHIITCTRMKMETVMGDDKKVKKVGMKDIQRDGWEYDLSISLNVDRDTHNAQVSKDRTGLFEGKDAFIITSDTGRIIREWCETGVDTKEAIAIAIANLENCNDVEELKMFRDTLPDFVIKADDFKIAATLRYNKIIKPKAPSA